MKPTLRHFAVLLVLSLVLPPANRAQTFVPASPPAGTEAPALRVAVAEIEDSRTKRDGVANNQTALTLKIASESFRTGTTLQAIKLTKVLDDRGRDIAVTSVSARPFLTAGTLYGTAVLRGVPRDAESLRFIEGTIELFVPAAINGSNIPVANIASHPGPVTNSYLAGFGIQVQLYGNRERYDQLCTAMGIAPTPLPGFPRAFGFHVQDPRHMLKGWSIMDSSGREIPSLRSNQRPDAQGGTLYNIELDTTPPAGMVIQLILLSGDPGSVQTVPFRIDDIKLP